MTMILAIVGGRDFDDYDKMDACLEDIVDKVEMVVSGGQRKDEKGADTLAIWWAKQHNKPYKEHLPDWDKYGKRAGPIRNELIIADSTHVAAFWDGKSKGTKSSIDLARKYKRRIRIIHY